MNSAMNLTSLTSLWNAAKGIFDVKGKQTQAGFKADGEQTGDSQTIRLSPGETLPQQDNRGEEVILEGYKGGLDVKITIRGDYADGKRIFELIGTDNGYGDYRETNFEKIKEGVTNYAKQFGISEEEVEREFRKMMILDQQDLSSVSGLPIREGRMLGGLNVGRGRYIFLDEDASAVDAAHEPLHSLGNLADSFVQKGIAKLLGRKNIIPTRAINEAATEMNAQNSLGVNYNWSQYQTNTDYLRRIGDALLKKGYPQVIERAYFGDSSIWTKAVAKVSGDRKMAGRIALLMENLDRKV